MDIDQDDPEVKELIADSNVVVKQQTPNTNTNKNKKKSVKKDTASISLRGVEVVSLKGVEVVSLRGVEVGIQNLAKTHNIRQNIKINENVNQTINQNIN